MKARIHREWFQPLAPKRKSCPTCKAKLPPGEVLYAWGEYHRAKWHTVKHFCKECFAWQVRWPLLEHAGPCGCAIELVARSGYRLPEWLTLTKES